MRKSIFMLGAIILDDYYFHFEEVELEELREGKEVKGLFAFHIVKCEFSVKVRKPNAQRISSDILIDGKKKRAHLYIMDDDFDNWFINPDDPEWAKDHCMPIRFASMNIYATRGISTNASVRKGELERTIAEAE